MLTAYRIRPVVEYTDRDGEVSYHTAASLAEAEREINEFSDRHSFSGREGKTLFWGIYGVNPPKKGVCTEDEIGKKLSVESAKRLMAKIIGPFTLDAQGYCTPIPNLVETMAESDIDPLIPTSAPIASGKRIRARFVPEAWIHDCALEIDGALEFDVTDRILAMSPAERSALRDDSHKSDLLVPDCILWHYSGPFRVEIKQAIEDYFQDENTALKSA